MKKEPLSKKELRQTVKRLRKEKKKLLRTLHEFMTEARWRQVKHERYKRHVRPHLEQVKAQMAKDFVLPDCAPPPPPRHRVKMHEGAFVAEQPHGGLVQDYEKGEAYRFTTLDEAQQLVDAFNDDPLDPRVPVADNAPQIVVRRHPHT